MADQFQGFTLVDITPTGVLHNHAGNEHARNQQRNWETVIQLMGLRTQPHIIKPPTAKVYDLGDGPFGEMYKGQHLVWAWTFRSEHPSAYFTGIDALGGLYQDFENIPIITGLDETARFLLPILHPYGAIKNIHFRRV
jgi:hypothetical protein